MDVAAQATVCVSVMRIVSYDLCLVTDFKFANPFEDLQFLHSSIVWTVSVVFPNVQRTVSMMRQFGLDLIYGLSMESLNASVMLVLVLNSVHSSIC